MWGKQISPSESLLRPGHSNRKSPLIWTMQEGRRSRSLAGDGQRHSSTADAEQSNVTASAKKGRTHVTMEMGARSLAHAYSVSRGSDSLCSLRPDGSVSAAPVDHGVAWPSGLFGARECRRGHLHCRSLASDQHLARAFSCELY